MELFTNALLITLGAFCAIVLVQIAYNAIQAGYAIWSLNKEKKETREWMVQVAENRERTKNHFRDLATEAVKNPEVSKIVEELRSAPYSYKKTKAAKKQNYERSKIQAKLRNLVADGNIRSAIYEMSNKEQIKTN